MENKIKLELGSTFNGEGFRQAQKAIDNTAKSVQKAASGMAGIGGELGKLDGKVGAVAGGISNLLGSLSGGPWGIAAAGIGMIVSLFVKWRNSVEETRKAHEELMAKMKEGYQRRLAKYVEEARKREIEALDAIIDKGKRALELINKRAAAYKTLAASENAVAKAKDREATAKAGSDERAKLTISNSAAMREAGNEFFAAGEEVRRVQKKIAALRSIIETQAKKGEDTTKAQDDLNAALNDLSVAQNNLKAAEINMAAVAQENANREKELGDKLHKAEEDRIKAEKDKAAAAAKAANRERNQERVDALNSKISAAKEARDKWEDKAKDARGKTFADWVKAEKDKADKEATDKQAFDAANKKYGERARRIRARFDAGRVVSKSEKAYMDQYESWAAMQDPKNNPAAKTLEELEREKAATTKNLDKTVSEIKEFLKKATTPES